MFLVSALILHTLNRGTSSTSVLEGVPAVQEGGLPQVPGFPGNPEGGGGAGAPTGGEDG